MHPFVSVVIPMRNEAESIKKCLDSLWEQDYDKDRYEILVIDGNSNDNSREIVGNLSKRCPKIRLLSNPDALTPKGINIGIRAARGEVIIILGAHSFVARDFITKNVEYLNKTKASCVGGTLQNVGESFLAKAISLAMATPFGVGNALFRYSQKERFVDTVAFGAYKREVFKRIGLFDEELAKDQDEEFNWRLRKAGGRLFLTPEIKIYYYPRGSLIKLFKQYYSYSLWKLKVFKKHPDALKLRHIVPTLFLVLLGISGIGGLVNRFLWGMFTLILGSYGIGAIAFSVLLSLKNGWKYFFILPIIFLTLHLSYGLGLLVAIFKVVMGRYELSRK